MVTNSPEPDSPSPSASSPDELRNVEEFDSDDDTGGRNRTASELKQAYKQDLIRRKRRTKTERERLYFQMINERVVNDVTLEFLYKPHTITVLVVLCMLLTYFAFNTVDAETPQNAYKGLCATGCLFLIMSAMAFPNGPFIRPHPIFWRIIFGLSVLYTMLLQFTLFQSFDDIKKTLKWIDPEELNKDRLDEKAYAVNCSDVTVARVWSYMDIFAVGHFLGWAMKAVLIRHTIICWYISIAWELTEMVFAHLLPNFQECWWDALLLDVVFCNGLGIWFGMKVCQWLEMRQFHWESIKNIKTTRGKFKRAVMQFTPESWTEVNWFNTYALQRTGAFFAFIMLSELNTFFMKHIFAVDTAHPIVFWRIILIGLISSPSIRQFYVFVTDPRVKRLGMQCWVYCAVCALELAICVKFGRSQFPPMKIKLIVGWMALMAVGAYCSVAISVYYAKKSSLTASVKVPGGDEREIYIDSSHENLGVIGNDVRRRRKKLFFSESDFS